MARGRGEYYEGAEPNPQNQLREPLRPRNQLGALANLQGVRVAQGGGGEAEEPSRLGTAMRQQQMEPQEIQRRTEENRAWLQDPKTQAAMMAFAVNIMQPLGDGANMGDFVGALGRSIGAGASAAYDVEQADLAATEAQRKAALDEREMRVREGSLGLQERKLDAELGEGQKREFSKVVKATDPENARYNLGLTGNQSAKVKFTENALTGETSASVESEFGGESSATELKSGQRIVYDAAGNPRVENIPGGAAEQAEQDAVQDALKRQQSQAVQAGMMRQDIDQAIGLIAARAQPNMTITGWGSFLSYLPATDANTLNNILTTIKTNIGYDKLAEMRENSPTGGAIGQVTENETRWLQSMLGSLEQAQDAQQLVNNLARIKVLYGDIVDGGQAAILGQMVKDGTLTFEQATSQMNKYVDQSLGLNVDPDPKKMFEAEVPETPPAFLDDRDTANWRYYSPDQKLQILELYRADGRAGGKEVGK